MEGQRHRAQLQNGGGAARRGAAAPAARQVAQHTPQHPSPPSLPAARSLRAAACSPHRARRCRPSARGGGWVGGWGGGGGALRTQPAQPMVGRPLAPQVREYLEKNWADTSGTDTIKLAIRALMETVEASSKNIEVAVMER